MMNKNIFSFYILYFCATFIIKAQNFGAQNSSMFPGYTYNDSQKNCYYIKSQYGRIDIIKNAGNIAVEFYFDSIGKNWNEIIEADFIRFKIFHNYIQHREKGGEKWINKYQKNKSVLYDTAVFDNVMEKRLKKYNIRLSPTFKNTKYTMRLYFIDAGIDANQEEFQLVFQVYDNDIHTILLQYKMEKGSKNEFDKRGWEEMSSLPGNEDFLATCKNLFIYLSRKL